MASKDGSEKQSNKVTSIGWFLDIQRQSAKFCTPEKKDTATEQVDSSDSTKQVLYPPIGSVSEQSTNNATSPPELVTPSTPPEPKFANASAPNQQDSGLYPYKMMSSVDEVFNMDRSATINTVPQNKSGDTTNIYLNEHYKGIIMEEVKQLSELIAKVEEMNIMELNDSIVLSPYMMKGCDEQAISYILSEYYKEKYATIIQQCPEISEWIMCVVHLIINGNFEKTAAKSDVSPYSDVARVRFDHYWFMMMKKSIPKSKSLIQAIKSALRDEKSIDDVDVKYPSYLESLEFFKTHPSLLRLGSLIKRLVPSCFAPAFMSVVETPISIKNELGQSVCIDGVTINFSSNILCRLPYNGTKKCHMMKHTEQLNRIVENMTGKTSVEDSFTTKVSTNGCFILNSAGRSIAEYEKTERILYGVFKKAVCTGRGFYGFNIEVPVNSTFIFDNSPMFKKSLNNDMKSIEKSAIMYMDTANSSMARFYTKLGFDEVANYLRKHRSRIFYIQEKH